MVHLILSRVQASDFDTLVLVEFAAFIPDGGHNAMFGLDTSANREHAKSVFLKDMQSDASDCWLKIVDADANDRIVCGGNWKIYPTHVKADVDRKVAEVEAMMAKDARWEDAKQKEDAIILTKEFLGRRYKRMREPHVYREYHGKGAGRMMVKWGCDLADHLMLPCFVEGSLEGEHLYRSMGFETLEKPYHKTESLPLPEHYSFMRRPVKVSKLEGSRAVSHQKQTI